MNNKTNIEEDINTTKNFIEYAQEIINDMEYERPVDVTIYQKNINSIENILADRERLERTVKSMSEEITHKQDEYCKHYCNALREYGQLQSKANKYDSLIEKIKEKIENLNIEEKKLEDNISNEEYTDGILHMGFAYIFTQKEVLQELLDTEKE